MINSLGYCEDKSDYVYDMYIQQCLAHTNLFLNVSAYF